MPKLNKHSLNNSTICEALPIPVLFVRHVVIVSIPFPYPKCHDVKLVVILCPSLVNFSLQPSLANWLQLWSEYSPESLVWVIINKTLYMYLVDVPPVRWLLLVMIVQWDSLFSVPGTYIDDQAHFTFLMQFCLTGWCVWAGRCFIWIS